MMENSEAFESLVGQELPFYGVDCNCFKVGGFVFEAIEDPDDGYRSLLMAVEVVNPKGRNLIFFDESIAKVRLEKGHEICPSTGNSFNAFYYLKDVMDGHVWLKFGTDESDNYYPCFVFEYTPKEARYAAKTCDAAATVCDMIGEGRSDDDILEWLHSTAAVVRYGVNDLEIEKFLLGIVRNALSDMSELVRSTLCNKGEDE